MFPPVQKPDCFTGGAQLPAVQTIRGRIDGRHIERIQTCNHTNLPILFPAFGNPDVAQIPNIGNPDPALIECIPQQE